MTLRKYEHHRLSRRRSKGVLRLAFTLAIAGSLQAAATTPSAIAQSSMPSLPAFPLAGVNTSDSPATARQSAVKRTDVSAKSGPAATSRKPLLSAHRRLVGLLGFATPIRGNSSSSAASYSAAESPGSAMMCTGDSCSLPPSSDNKHADSAEHDVYDSTSVVTAAATESFVLNLNDGQPTANETDSVDSKPESLLDIPLELPMPMSGNSPIAPEIVAEIAAEPGETIEREATERTIVRAPSKSASVEPTDSPELVRQSRRVSVGSTETQSKSNGKSLNLSDSTAGDGMELPAAEPAQFSLNDNVSEETEASQEEIALVELPLVGEGLPRPTGSLPSTSPDGLARESSSRGTARPKAMQVKIEGEPALVLPRGEQVVSATKPAPAPTFNSASEPGKLEQGKSSRRQPLVELVRQRAEPPVVSESRNERRLPATLASSQFPSPTDSALVEQAVNNVADPAERTAVTQQTSSGDRLVIAAQDSMLLHSPSAIVETSIEHPEICQLLTTSERSVSVIGMQAGSTRIAIVTYDATGQRQVEIHEVTVGQSSSAGASLNKLTRDITSTVRQLFPRSDVEISALDGKLVVRGIATSEADAKRILSLVRKTSLMPVVDQVQAY